MDTTDQTPTEPDRWRIQTTCDKDEIEWLLAGGWEPFGIYRDMVALRKLEPNTHTTTPTHTTASPRAGRSRQPAEQA